MQRPDHPYHGPMDHYSCGVGQCGGCTGYVGPLDTYVCGCCCHDERFGRQSDEAR